MLLKKNYKNPRAIFVIKKNRPPWKSKKNPKNIKIFNNIGSHDGLKKNLPKSAKMPLIPAFFIHPVYSKLLHKMGSYFLDAQYVFVCMCVCVCFCVCILVNGLLLLFFKSIVICSIYFSLLNFYRFVFVFN